MPRQARIDSPDAIHHVIARGIERSKIFRNDYDRQDFLQRLGKLVKQTETRCYAWALIPNHFHLLLKTGKEPISNVMRRLLTGYAVGHNRRHRRSGHLFQNRYKSILCQQDAYLKELVRYIHLNPMRAGLVKNLEDLDKYPYAGHSALMGRIRNEWQSTEEVLAFFGQKTSRARRMYHDYVEAGVEQGRRPVLTGGGLIRSAGGWAGVQALRRAGEFQKSDERILGDGEFVKSVLSDAAEKFARKYALRAEAITLDRLFRIVAAATSVHPEDLIGPTKVRKIGRARVLYCYWAVRDLGYSMTEVANKLNVSLPTVSVAVPKGDQLVRDGGFHLEDYLNINI